jgi:hypothetical protein
MTIKRGYCHLKITKNGKMFHDKIKLDKHVLIKSVFVTFASSKCSTDRKIEVITHCKRGIIRKNIFLAFNLIFASNVTLVQSISMN